MFTLRRRIAGLPLFQEFGNDNNLFLVTLATGEQHRFASGDSRKTLPAFSPDGRMIAYESEGDIW